MDLRVADARGLVEFIHRAVSKHGRRVLTSGDYTVVEFEGGSFFYHAERPVRVGGPFASIEHLLRSEGVRRFPPTHVPDSAEYEVFEWADSFFRIEPGQAEIRQYWSLEEA